MVVYDKSILKAIRKNKIPTRIIDHFNNSFIALDTVKDYTLFDIKVVEGKIDGYYRLRKGKYRAIFTTQDDDIYVAIIGKRDEVYKLWEQQQ